MNRSTNMFAMLADRAEKSNSNDNGELRRTLEPEMVRIVRRVVLTGHGHSSMARRILVEAQRVGLDADLANSLEGDRLIQSVAHSVSSLFVNGLRSKSAHRFAGDETIRN